MSETPQVLGKGDSLHQQVLASFPLCDLTEEDLTQNPQFCKLLATLAQHVDKTGLTTSLKTDLEKAEQKLQSQKRQWLRSEVLYKGLQEMIQDYKVKKHHAPVPPDQSMLKMLKMTDLSSFEVGELAQSFCETLEKCLLVAQCAKQLDPSSTTNQDQPLLLGLTPEDVMELIPPERDVQRMRQSVPKQLEKHLKAKCLSLLTYYQPECENESEGLKVMKLSHLPAQLDKEKKRAESLEENCRENTLLLQRQIQLYLSELTKCLQILQTLILHHRLKVQTDLDRKKLDYFEGKCELVLQKIKSEMVGIQLETYTSDTIAAHKQIRESLESELKACKAEKQSAESQLASFEILGKEFEALAEEYCKIRREVEAKSWAVKELTQYGSK